MNEFVEEIKKKCTVMNGDVEFFDKDKFVELIVRECVDICIYENVSALDIGDLMDSSKFKIQELATISCGEHLATIIKKRFGVE